MVSLSLAWGFRCALVVENENLGRMRWWWLLQCVCFAFVFCQRAAVQRWQYGTRLSVAATRTRSSGTAHSLASRLARSRLSPHPVTAVGRMQIPQIALCVGLRCGTWRRRASRAVDLCARRSRWRCRWPWRVLIEGRGAARGGAGRFRLSNVLYTAVPATGNTWSAGSRS